MNLDFVKMCGKHSAIYEAYYKQIDPKGSGAIEAMTAAKFLKKSGLSDVVLSRVWDLSDPSGKGFLDKPGFFVALKLVSLAQSGQVINMSNIYVETANPPKVGDLPKIVPQRTPNVPSPIPPGGSSTGDWSISVIDRLKYEQLFESLQPVGGMLPGNKVKGVLMDSKLPMDILGKIWDLADQDKDGNLDKYEFIVAMHLVYQTLDKRTIPNVLPPELRKPGGGVSAPPPKPPPMTVLPTMPRAPSGEGFGNDGGFVANFPKDIAPPPALPPLPVAVPPMTRIPPVGSAAQPSLIGGTDPLIPIGAPPSVTANADWVVTLAEQKRFEVMFRDSDRDKDGLVSGLEVKNIFLQSGVPQQCLAHIWALCDTNQSGKLTLEQFSLAMWMVERKQKGLEPPQVLTANMVPPSMRSILSGVDVQQQVESKPTYSNPELEMISKEIEELARERRALETEIAQKEADVRIKSGEVRSLQSELDTLMATLKQLENQRGEAQKRLDDLKAQSTECQALLEHLNLDLSQSRNQVTKIREQCQKQEDTINEQEGELNAKRSELQKLKDEEAALQKEYDENNRELQRLTLHLTNTQLQISSVRSMVTQLLETQRQMTDALLLCRAAIENQDGEIISEYQLKIEPDFDEARKVLEKKIEEPPKIDPFADHATKSNGNGFSSSNGFESDPFSGTTATAIGSGGVGALRSGFDDSFSATSGFDGGFDAFGSGNAFGQQQQRDPFGSDAFGASKNNAITPEPGKDDFGSDPFAALHAPTGQGQVLSPNTQKSGPPPRPESPSPALPPKKSKVPPPRPAPPRPMQGPSRPAQPGTMDAFGSTTISGGGNTGFADFADFDNKISTIPSAASNATQSTFAAFGSNNNNNNNTGSNASLFDSINADRQPTTTKTSTMKSISPTFTNLSSGSIISESAGGGITIANAFRLPPAPPLFFGTEIPPLPSSSSSSPSLPNMSDTLSTSPIFDTSYTEPISKTNLTTNSIVPTQQQQQSSTIHAAQAGLATSLIAAAATTGKKVISGPTDFSDDPFKDYRYEDPFSIKDPFDDDADTDLTTTDPSKVFKDDLSSDDDITVTASEPANRVNNNNNSTRQIPNKSTSSLNMEFVHQFDAFNVNPSPAPSQKSTASGTLPHKTTAIDDDNDNDNGARKRSNNKSEGNTPVSLGLFDTNFDSNFDSKFDSFADFDAFSLKSTSTVGSTSAFEVITHSSSSPTTTTTTTTQNTMTTTKDSFFDAFEDDFNSNTTFKAPESINSTMKADGFEDDDDDTFETVTNVTEKSTNNNVDPFGARITTTATATNTNKKKNGSSNLFDAFNTNDFEDYFFKDQKPTTGNESIAKDVNLNLHTITDSSSSSSNNNNNISSSGIIAAPMATIDDFAKFDAFDAIMDDDDGFGGENLKKNTLNNSINTNSSINKNNITKVQNETMLSKMQNVEIVVGAAGIENINNLKKTDKFTADYSKPETFDNDLQEALKRSMVDQ